MKIKDAVAPVSYTHLVDLNNILNVTAAERAAHFGRSAEHHGQLIVYMAVSYTHLDVYKRQALAPQLGQYCPLKAVPQFLHIIKMPPVILLSLIHIS